MRKLIAVAAVFIAVAASAQDARTLADQALSEYYAKHFAKSAELFRAAIATGNATPSDYYNGACSMSLAGLKDEAFATLEALAKKGYSNADQLVRDSDLDPLHDDPRWTALLASVRANAAAYAKKWDAPGIGTPYQENISNEEKIAGLSRAWSEARYNFANFDLVPDLDWDALYMATIPRALATKSTLAYYDVLTAFVAQLHDGHTGVWMPKPLLDVRYGMPAIRQEMIDGHVVVIRAGDPGGAMRVGDEIVTVDGQPWRAYADRNVTPYVSASTPQDREHRTANELLFGPAGSKVTLGVRGADGALRIVELERFGGAKRVPLIDGPFELRMLPGNVAYVALNEFETRKRPTSSTSIGTRSRRRAR